jgi:hypothetical protein
MPIIRSTSGQSDDSYEPFSDDESLSALTNLGTNRDIQESSSSSRPDEVTTEQLASLTPELGEFVFDRTLSHNKYWNGTSWIPVIPIDEVEQLVKEDIQGYIGLLSGVYFGDANGTASEIAIEDVDVWQDVIMTIQAPVSGVHAGGVSDERITDMELANTQGYEGTGADGSPIKFLLEGLVQQSSATLRTSLTFVPDEDGGRLDSRIFLERHSGASPSDDFPINAAGLAMESGADEEYPHLVNVQFFVGDTINTNGAGDAGKIRFQIKSDVTGTIYMNEMALFIQL